MSANDVGALWREFVDLVGVFSRCRGWLGSVAVWLAVGRALKPLASFSDAFVRIGAWRLWRQSFRKRGPWNSFVSGHGVNDMARSLMVDAPPEPHAWRTQLRTLQDEERADLARDLHDEIGPHLFAVNVDVGHRAADDRRRRDRAGARPRLTAIQEGAAHMQGLVRDILGRLRPTELIDLGLAAAVDELVAFWRGRHPAIGVRGQSAAWTRRSPQALREPLYRIIQEGLNNAVRHASRPTRVAVDGDARRSALGHRARSSTTARHAGPSRWGGLRTDRHAREGRGGGAAS